MKDPFDPGHDAIERAGRGDIANLERQAGVVAVLFEVVAAAGCEIVDHDDLMAVRQQTVDQVTADEAGTAGNEALKGGRHSEYLRHVVISAAMLAHTFTKGKKAITRAGCSVVARRDRKHAKSIAR
jgi:hypothetical protein